MNNESLEKVIDFVAEFWREPKGRLFADTRINDNLGMDGDDGVEFMQAFSERFGVDLRAFPHEKYFGPEAGATPFSMIEGIVRRVTTGKWSALTPLTLRDLAEAAERQRWLAKSQPEI